MSFHEKSNVTMLVAIVLVYGWYFLQMIGIAQHAPVHEGLVALGTIAPVFAVTVVVLVVISIVAHIAIVVYEKRTYGVVDDKMDERDRLIELRGESRGGVVVSFGVLIAMGMLLIGNSAFLIANTLLAFLVVSEIVKGVSKLLDYRRGV